MSTTEKVISIILFVVVTAAIIGITMKKDKSEIEVKQDFNDIYYRGIHYRIIGNITVNVTKDSLEMLIYKDYQNKFTEGRK
jgi:hypothetical protein